MLGAESMDKNVPKMDKLHISYVDFVDFVDFTPAYLKQNKGRFEQSIARVQLNGLVSAVGRKMANKLLDSDPLEPELGAFFSKYVKPWLVYASYYEILKTAGVAFTPAGQVTRQADGQSSQASPQQAAEVKNYYASEADNAMYVIHKKLCSNYTFDGVDYTSPLPKQAIRFGGTTMYSPKPYKRYSNDTNNNLLP